MYGLCGSHVTLEASVSLLCQGEVDHVGKTLTFCPYLLSRSGDKIDALYQVLP